MARAELAYLKTLGITPTPDEIIELDSLGRMAQFGGVVNPTSLLLTGERIGCNVFYPLTIGASIWYQDKACEWFVDDEDTLGVVMLYLLAHSREPEYYMGIENARECRKVVRKWARSVNVTADEALCAIERLTPSSWPDLDDEQSDDSVDLHGNPIDARQPDYVPMLAVLQRVYGQTTHHWLHEVSAEHAHAMAKEGVAQICAERGVEVPRSDDPAILGAYHLLKCRERIMQAHGE